MRLRVLATTVLLVLGILAADASAHTRYYKTGKPGPVGMPQVRGYYSSLASSPSVIRFLPRVVFRTYSHWRYRQRICVQYRLYTFQQIINRWLLDSRTGWGCAVVGPNGPRFTWFGDFNFGVGQYYEGYNAEVWVNWYAAGRRIASARHRYNYRSDYRCMTWRCHVNVNYVVKPPRATISFEP
jgi:hypothetical protein